jgi:hypothetical protein
MGSMQGERYPKKGAMLRMITVYASAYKQAENIKGGNHDDMILQKHGTCKTSCFLGKHYDFLGTCDFRGFGSPWYV